MVPREEEPDLNPNPWTDQSDRYPLRYDVPVPRTLGGDFLRELLQPHPNPVKCVPSREKVRRPPEVGQGIEGGLRLPGTVPMIVGVH